MSRNILTDRLLLRLWSPADFEAHAAFYTNEDAARFVGGKMIPERAWRRLAQIVGHWVLRGYGYWAVEERKTGRLAGCVGLWRSEGWPELELGYWLAPEMQGHGYAVEAGRAARDHAWSVVRPESLVSYIHPDNPASMRVAERLGAKRDGLLELLDYGPHLVYRYPVPEP